MAEAATNSVVTQRIEVAPGLVILRVVPDGWELPEFVPGQFAVLGLTGSAPRCPLSEPDAKPRDPDKLIKRAYSIASSSVAREYMEFFITLVHSGALTPRLFDLQHGDRVWLSPKASGLFTIEEVPPESHIVMISTGTGLAPYMSMLRTQLACGGERRFAVLHGARHSWDLGYRSELITLERLCSNVTYIPSISRPNNEPVKWAGQTGYVQDLWIRRLIDADWGFHPTPENTHVFLCGNPAMIEQIVKLLGTEGFSEHSRKNPGGQIHLERYW